MADPKPLASLSSGLLARKGDARPAMRRQNPIASNLAAHHHNQEDLGWNDMGYDVDPEVPESAEGHEEHAPRFRPLTAAIPEVVRQQDSLAEKLRSADLEEEDDAYEPAPVEEVRSPLMQRKAMALPAIDPAEQAAEYMDMATPVEAPVARPVVSVPAPAPERAPRAAADRSRRSAFTLRVDPERHLKLRLACAVSGRSAQQLVTQALDEFLKTLPEVDELAGRLPDFPGR